MTNRPVNFNDPTGHKECNGEIEECLGARYPTRIPPAVCTTCPSSEETPDPWNDPEYSEWFSGDYSGCTLCHYSVTLGKGILTNQELATADHNFREWAAAGYTPMVGVMAVGGAAEFGPALTYTAAIECLKSPICAKVIGAGGGVTVLGKIKPYEDPPGYVRISQQVNGRVLHTPAWTPDLQSQFMAETKALGQPVFLADNYTQYPGSVLNAEVTELIDDGWTLILNILLYPPKPN